MKLVFARAWFGFDMTPLSHMVKVTIESRKLTYTVCFGDVFHLISRFMIPLIFINNISKL